MLSGGSGGFIWDEVDTIYQYKNDNWQILGNTAVTRRGHSVTVIESDDLWKECKPAALASEGRYL